MSRISPGWARHLELKAARQRLREKRKAELAARKRRKLARELL